MDKGLVERALKETMLIERHIEILNLVHKQGPIGIMKISELLKIPVHKVRYSLRIIENEGLISASSEGATVTYKVPDELINIDKELDNLVEIIKQIKIKLKSY